MSVQRITQQLKRIFWALIALYGIGVTTFTVLQWTIGEQFVVVAWLNNFAHLLWIGAAFLLMITVIFRRDRTLLLFILPGIAFAVNYVPMYLPRTVDPPENARVFSVMTYNVHVSRSDPDKVVADILNSGADIVAIQELSPTLASAIHAGLADVYRFQALYPQSWFHGQGVISKYPILESEYWKIYLGHQATKIDVGGTVISLYNTHPIHHALPFWGFDITRRTEEIDVVLDRAQQDGGYVILAGDFNMTDLSADYQRVTETYRDSYREVGYGMGTTFPAHIPVLPSLARIDYIFYSAEFRALKAQVLRVSGGSDHRPLLVDFALDEVD